MRSHITLVTALAVGLSSTSRRRVGAATTVRLLSSTPATDRARIT